VSNPTPQLDPLLNLVWLFWIITSPWFSGTLGARRIAITYASVAVFLTLYHRAWYGQCRRATINAAPSAYSA